MGLTNNVDEVPQGKPRRVAGEEWFEDGLQASENVGAAGVIGDNGRQSDLRHVGWWNEKKRV